MIVCYIHGYLLGMRKACGFESRSMFSDAIIRSLGPSYMLEGTEQVLWCASGLATVAVCHSS
jgi:hypothetical protein